MLYERGPHSCSEFVITPDLFNQRCVRQVNENAPMVGIAFYHRSRYHANPPSTTANLAQSVSQLSQDRKPIRVTYTVLK